MTVLKIPRQPLPDAPRHRDGRPMGSRCRPACHRPTATQCHCATCHQSMRTLTSFDAHRQDGYCLDLSAMGLVESGGLWATPEGHEAADRARELADRGRAVQAAKRRWAA